MGRLPAEGRAVSSGCRLLALATLPAGMLVQLQYLPRGLCTWEDSPLILFPLPGTGLMGQYSAPGYLRQDKTRVLRRQDKTTREFSRVKPLVLPYFRHALVVDDDPTRGREFRRRLRLRNYPVCGTFVTASESCSTSVACASVGCWDKCSRSG